MPSLSFSKVKKVSLAEFERLADINIAYQCLHHDTIPLASC